MANQQSEINFPYNIDMILSPTDVGAVIQEGFTKTLALLIARDRTNNIWRMVNADGDGTLKVTGGGQSVVEPRTNFFTASSTLQQVLLVNNKRQSFLIQGLENNNGTSLAVWYDAAQSFNAIPINPGYFWQDELWQGGVWVNINAGTGTQTFLVTEWSD